MKSESIDFDSILQEIGAFGWYQRIHCLLLSFVIIFSALPLLFTFTTRQTNYRCYIEGCDPVNNTEALYNAPWLHSALPFDNDKPLSCSKYSRLAKSRKLSCNLSDFDRNTETSCDFYVFEHGDATIERDFNLTCKENIWKLAAVGSINDFAEVIGLPLSGFLSDRYGRRHVMIIGASITSLLGFIKSFLATYESYLLVEFVEGLFASGVFSAAYILAIELVSPQHRVLCSTLLISTFTLGETYLCFISWWTESWRQTCRILYLPGLLFISYYYLLGESIRWLLVNNRIDQAQNTLIRIARWNGVVPINDRVLEKLNLYHIDDEQHGAEKSESMWRVFESLTLTVRFISCSFVWMTCTFIFYGLNMQAVAIVGAGNLYLNYLASILVEIPAHFACYWVLNDRRRKPVMTGSLLAASVSCLLLLVITHNVSEIIIFAMAKLWITIALSTFYVYAAEVFPTSIRHSLLAGCSLFGRLGGMAAPQVPVIAQISPSFVYILFMLMALTSTLLVMTFPESVNTNLPDTINQAVSIGYKSTE